MFERLVRFSLANRGAVLFFTLVVVVAGVYAFRELTIEANSRPDYKERLTKELNTMANLEIWRAGKTVRKLRP